MRRTRGEKVDGVLLLDKPGGVTSNLALLRARRLLGARKAGHTGTLDPLATGLLPLAFGEATKFAADALDADKRYTATLRLGETTTTGDAEGEIVERRDVALARDALLPVLQRFTGAVEQVPPMHSALKRAGQPLYRLARAGVTVERAARRVTIHALTLSAFDGRDATVEVECSKGTYVRVLAEDIGAALGCGAHLIALRRTGVGPLRIDAAIDLVQFEGLDPAARRERLLPVDALLSGLPRLDLGADDARRFSLGQSLPLGERPSARVRVYDRAQHLLGLARIDACGVVAPLRLIAAAESLSPHPAAT